MHNLTLDHLRADASRIMNNLVECWSDGAAINHVANTLKRVHPLADAEVCICAAEQARWGAWP